MTITPQMVKELREKSGAGMMDCKRALQEASGDVDTAMENLRKKGIAKAEKKSSRKAAEGLLGFVSNNNGGVLVEINCETDFVAKTDDFKNYVDTIAKIIEDNKPTDLEQLMNLTLDGKNIKDYQTDLVAKIGENLGIKRFVMVEGSNGEKFAQYIHAGNKVGTMIIVEDPEGKVEDKLIKEIAMHIAAMSPSYVRKEEIPENVVEKEKEIIKAQMGDTKKPPEIMEKIVQGKIGKQLGEMCLDDQVFVCDLESKQTVGKVLSSKSNQAKVKKFIRYQVGEEL